MLLGHSKINEVYNPHKQNLGIATAKVYSLPTRAHIELKQATSPRQHSKTRITTHV